MINSFTLWLMCRYKSGCVTWYPILQNGRIVHSNSINIWNVTCSEFNLEILGVKGYECEVIKHPIQKLGAERWKSP
jgi:hypothetical protein